MYLLYAVEYPPRRLGRAVVENAWTAAGLTQPVPRLAEEVAPEAVRDLMVGVLTEARATPVAGAPGDMEVPRSARHVLERLEDFYHRLYPETRASPARGHFHYEELEWLGEF